jgi:hypothetical protein
MHKMEIKILAAEEVEFKEKDVQTAFERDLSKLESGLEMIDTEVVIGTGRIDTLAFDMNSGCPVFIEYKRPGEFDKDALIQLMDYLSWFARDENRMAVLEKIIRKRKPDIDEFVPTIRLICVVPDIDDRIRNAIYAIANHVKIVSYLVARDTANNVVLVPKLELDNEEVERQIRGAATESEILNKHNNLKDLFLELRSHLESDGAVSYTTARSFRFKKDFVFGVLRFRKKYIQLELRPGQGKINDPDFKYWRQGASSWGYTYLYPSTSIPEKVISWIALARNFTGEVEDDDDVEADS